MKATWLTGLVVASLAAIAATPQEAELKKLFKDVEAVKKSARKLSKESRDKIEKAIGGKLDDKEAAGQIWEGRALVPEAHPSEKVRVLYTVVTAKGPKGEIKLGVAVAVDDRVVAGVAVLENQDAPEVASPDFLDQFTRFIYTASLSSPAGALAEAKAKAKERKDEAGKQLDAIFKLHTIMHPVGTSWTALQKSLDNSEATGAEHAEKLVTAFNETRKLLGDMTFLKSSSATSFGKRLDESVRLSQSISQKMKVKDFVGANNAAHELEKASCSQCHAGTQRIFREKRNELNIGNGYFAIGHDVVAPEGNAAAYEAVATAIRRATLILSEAK